MNITKALTKQILEKYGAYEWSLQGFGMLRTYLTPELRLHVWDARFAVKDVSTVHTHPWNFVSLVVAGKVHNYRYAETLTEGTYFAAQKIICGVGGGPVEDPKGVRLVRGMREAYGEGDTYKQNAGEIHRSDPVDGTVTIVEREFLDDTEHAFVFYQGEWVSAEPRAATDEEVDKITTNALGRWFND